MKHRICFSGLSSHKALLLTRVFSETRGLLKTHTNKMANCLAQAKALRQGTAIDVDGQTREILSTSRDVREQLEEASWKFIGMDLPLDESGTRVVGIIEVLFGNQEQFEKTVRVNSDIFGIDERWMTDLKDLVILGNRNIMPLIAQLSAATKSGLLLAVEDGGVEISKRLAALPSTHALSRNKIGPHPLSEPQGGGSADQENVEINRNFNGLRLARPALRKDLPKTMIYSQEELQVKQSSSPKIVVEPNPAGSVLTQPKSVPSVAEKDEQAAPLPPPSPFGSAAVKVSKRKPMETTTQFRRRKRFE